MLNKCSVYSCLIKSALEHAGSTLPLIYLQGKSTEVQLVHLSSYKQTQALEGAPDITIICTGLGFSTAHPHLHKSQAVNFSSIS